MNSLFYCMDKQPETMNNVLRLNFLEFIYFEKYLIKIWLFEIEQGKLQTIQQSRLLHSFTGKDLRTLPNLAVAFCDRSKQKQTFIRAKKSI